MTAVDVSDEDYELEAARPRSAGEASRFRAVGDDEKFVRCRHDQWFMVRPPDELPPLPASPQPERLQLALDTGRIGL
jgi:hypothetical protein